MTETRGVGANRAISGSIPKVAIVGRPNVGKSCLFNRLTESRRALVHDLPGVTRDRVAGVAEWIGRKFELCDTGGIDPGSDDILLDQVTRQAMRAAQTADVVVFLVDGRTGCTGLDEQLAADLHRLGLRHVLCAVNKLDTVALGDSINDFAALGIRPILGVSAEHGIGISELLDAIVERLPVDHSTPSEETDAPPEAPDSEAVRIALIGRPNVGKSTLFNCLIDDDRSVTSEIAGTTRDTVDVLVRRDDRSLLLLDTAGIRRRGRTEQGPEVLSVVKARKTIEAAHVVALVLDASEPLAHQDAAVAGLADEKGKAMVVALTKSDLLTGGAAQRKEIGEELTRKLRFLSHVPRVWVSGKTGHGLNRLLRAVYQVDRAATRRVSTAELNRFVAKQLSKRDLQAPGISGIKVLYATQTGIRPPTFTLFVSGRLTPHFSTERFVVNQLRKAFELDGTPIRVHFRSRKGR